MLAGHRAPIADLSHRNRDETDMIMTQIREMSSRRRRREARAAMGDARGARVTRGAVRECRHGQGGIGWGAGCGWGWGRPAARRLGGAGEWRTGEGGGVVAAGRGGA